MLSQLLTALVRSQVLQAQEDAVQSVQKEARDALLAIAGNKKIYQALLTDLLVCSHRLQRAVPLQPPRHPCTDASHEDAASCKAEIAATCPVSEVCSHQDVTEATGWIL